VTFFFCPPGPPLLKKVISISSSGMGMVICYIGNRPLVKLRLIRLGYTGCRSLVPVWSGVYRSQISFMAPDQNDAPRIR
jgi:hypothetical protein